jgi:polysaccharide export outer membrane protein
MNWQTSRVGIPAKRLLYFSLLLAILASLAVAQDAPAAKPAQDAPAPKPAQPAATDNPPAASTGVRPDSYVIGAEDVITVYVWKEPDVSKTVPVRPDGMISLPLVGEIKAAGYTPVQLQDVLAAALKKTITDPEVTVMVEKIGSLSFNIVGEIAHPGYFPLTRRMTVLDAIAMAGGFRDFAKTKKVYVLRTAANGTQERLPFNYKDVIHGKNEQQNIELQPRDTIVVP